MTIHKEVLEVAFKTQSNNERHRTVAETRYWCDQYKLLAKTAIEALAQPEQEPVACVESYALKDLSDGRLSSHTFLWNVNRKPDSTSLVDLYTTPPRH